MSTRLKFQITNLHYFIKVTNFYINNVGIFSDCVITEYCIFHKCPSSYIHYGRKPAIHVCGASEETQDSIKISGNLQLNRIILNHSKIQITGCIIDH